MKKLSNTQKQKFQSMVWNYYHAHGRHDLPWRPPQLKIKNGRVDMYSVLVSEIMLQQTQVGRVLEKYTAWMRQFPTIDTLASAPKKEVLIAWQGLGYTRRAKFLHDAAISVMRHGAPDSVQKLDDLPGIGHYTARAIATFAWNQSHVLVETNVRTVYIDYFFTHKDCVTDKEILPLVEQTLDTNKPREWMYALMDYGSHLKSQGRAHNTRAKSFTKQSRFKGSVREVRGSIMKYITEKEQFTQEDRVQFEKKFDAERVKKALEGLMKDGLIQKTKEKYSIVE